MKAASIVVEMTQEIISELLVGRIVQCIATDMSLQVAMGYVSYVIFVICKTSVGDVM